MEKKRETTIMENQMENEMDTREYMRVIILGFINGICSHAGFA